jgi:AraC-like DNA-binding protein/mannose-6-phosphate isomerase-like protein (cupin superfamily)
MIILLGFGIILSKWGVFLLVIDEKGYEYQKWKGGSSFPVGSGISNLAHFCNKSFECHWHDGVELLYVVDGELMHTVNGQRFLMREGDFMFVNSGSMHEGQATELGRGRYVVVSFLTSLLCPEDKGRIADKYFGETMSKENFPLLFLPSSNPRAQAIESLCDEVCRLNKERPPCYELKIKSALFEVWAILFSEASERGSKQKSDVRISRIKRALEYIGENYQNKLTLCDIAASCNISESELCRSFKKAMHRTLFDYITGLRLRKSIELLEEGKSVTEAALSSGFFDSSYYTKMFKRYMNCTPRDYLKRKSR